MRNKSLLNASLLIGKEVNHARSIAMPCTTERGDPGKSKPPKSDSLEGKVLFGGE